MAKFYVESGEFRAVVDAQDAKAAALWAVHLAMEETTPLDELAVSDDQLDDLAFADDVTRLGMEICMSEVGFGRIDAGLEPTLDVMAEWNQLAMVMSQLDRFVDEESDASRAQEMEDDWRSSSDWDSAL